MNYSQFCSFVILPCLHFAFGVFPLSFSGLLLLVSRHIQFGFFIRFPLARSNMCNNSKSSHTHLHTFTHTIGPHVNGFVHQHTHWRHLQSANKIAYSKLGQIYKLNILLISRITVRHIVHAVRGREWKWETTAHRLTVWNVRWRQLRNCNRPKYTATENSRRQHFTSHHLLLAT